MTHSHGYQSKEYGIHNGERCVLKAWVFEEKDMDRLKNSIDREVVLEWLPKTLYIEMEKPLKKPYPGLPDKWFPLTPITTWWELDAQENICISRRGFPLVPNFSSTIHSATGRTLNSSIADVGDIFSYPSFFAAMKGYIAMSRVVAAHKILLAQPFSPLLFAQGPQPFPTLLLNVLQGRVPNERVEHESREAQKKYQPYLAMLDM